MPLDAPHGRRTLDLIVAVVALAKLGVGLGAFALDALHGLDQFEPRTYERVARMLAFGIAGGWLLLAAHRDSRAKVLGVCFLLIGSSGSDTMVRVQLAPDAVDLTLLERAMALQIDALMPFYMWRFVQAFPRAADLEGLRAWMRWGVAVSLAVAVVLMVGNLALALGAGRVPGLDRALLPLSRWSPREVYYPLQLALSSLALAALVAKIRFGAVEERRRARFFVLAMLIGAVPTICYQVVVSLAPEAKHRLPVHILGWILYPTLLSIPFATAYAVLVKQALDARLVLRLALQYALAKMSVRTIAIVPAALLVVGIWRARPAPVLPYLTAPSQLLLLAVAVGALIMTRQRGDVLQRIDRRFFREQYDARRILGQLVARCGTARDAGALAEVLCAEVDRALHLRAAHVLFLDSHAWVFVSTAGSARALDAGSPLVSLLDGSPAGLDVDVERPSDHLRALPDAEQHWLLESGARLLLALRDRRRQVVGVVALGEKRSELPFSSEDRELLASVATAAEMAMSHHDLHPSAAARGARDATTATTAAAAECPACGVVHAANVVACATCGALTVSTVVPRMLVGKFLIDRRVGAGGMGVVYRGTDVHLGRTVAIKTLPRLAPREAARLQREARTLAALSHPHIASIYGVEVWEGQPLLVLEYLHGTLADRLREGPLALDEALRLTFALLSVLEAMHARNVLHHDIKPSNIGFGEDGTPKLLDFGLARLLTVVSADRTDARRTAAGPGSHAGPVDGWPAAPSQSVGAIGGTPRYMSPEALDGQRPDFTFDLWSLAVVLYEAVLGRYPFQANRWSPLPPNDLPADRSFGARGIAMPPSLADFFVDCFAEERSDRPQTAREFGARLRVAARDVAIDRRRVVAGPSGPRSTSDLARRP